ncbi:DUF2268 domain-containing protein [Mesobacillus foraminis]|uniref:DUF2268 domain-containing protein n=1 Tax=Mesobacillus foraminis TaxID=279826 RepID=UPI0039A3E2E8
MRLYRYLLNFGMYKPNRQSWVTLKELVDANVWEKTEKLFIKYRQKWKGPDIPVYIFPMDKANFSLMHEGKGKSGVSFKDGLFLFLTPLTDENEIEALFVHEYHHVCRINSQGKQLTEYTLLDSMVLEGLAEHMVEAMCGARYIGKWCSKYSKDELKRYWERHLLPHLAIKKTEKLHDQLLFGLGNYPKLLGYAAGFEMVRQYKEQRKFTDKASFSIPAESIREHIVF